MTDDQIAWASILNASSVALRHSESRVSHPRSSPRPPLKWAGGKRWQLPHLRELWAPHRHRRLVEPFCGGLAVALGLMPQSALLNDVNPHVINLYRWLKRGLRTRLAMANDAAAYYRCRQRFNELIRGSRADTAEAAALFYYLNRTGYNGLCRFNRQGGFNVPFGRYRTVEYRTDFREYRAAFSGFEFTSLDFERLEVRSEDFIYADPPYRCPLHAVRAGRLRLGGAGAHGRVARAAPRPRRGLQPVDRSHRGAVLPPGLFDRGPDGAAPDQLHGRPHARPGVAGHTQSLNLVIWSIGH